MNYFLSSHNDVTGPFSEEVLLDSFSAGKIPHSAQICPEGSESWRPILALRSISGNSIVAQSAPSEYPVTVYNTYIQPKSTGVAVLLEVLPGIFLQTFGIGTMYAGNITAGLVIMLTYWAAMIVNVFLTMIVIGVITWPLTFVIYLIISIIAAQSAANLTNQRMMQQVPYR